MRGFSVLGIYVRVSRIRKYRDAFASREGCLKARLLPSFVGKVCFGEDWQNSQSLWVT